MFNWKLQMIKFKKIAGDPRPLFRLLAQAVDNDPEILALYCFGSYADGRVGPLSDVDLAVLLDREVPRDQYFSKRLSLHALAAHLLRTDEIDLVILNSAPPLLVHRVVKGGKLLYQRDPAKRIAFEVQAIRRYLDFAPVLDRCQEAMTSYILAVKSVA